MRHIPTLFVVLLSLNAYAKEGEVLIVFPREIRFDQNDALVTKTMSKQFLTDNGYCQLSLETPPNSYRVIETQRKLTLRPVDSDSNTFTLVDPSSSKAVASGYCYTRSENTLLKNLEAAFGAKPVEELRRIPVNLETEEKDTSGQTIAI